MDLSIYKYKPGYPLRPDAWEVVQAGQQWLVKTPRGIHPVSTDRFSTKAEAEKFASEARKEYEIDEAAQQSANLGSTNPDPSLNAPPSPSPSPAFPPGANQQMASGFRSSVPAAAHPDAFSVFGMGRGGSSFGVRDALGVDAGRSFGTANAAQAFADSLRSQFQAMQAASSGSSPSGASGWARASSGSTSVPSPSGASNWPQPSAGTAPASPGPASSFASSRPANPGGAKLGPIASVFERAFDASIGKAIKGSEQIVTRSVDIFKKGFGGFKSAIANPGATAAAFGSAASRATFGAQIVGGFAANRANAAAKAAAASIARSAKRTSRGIGQKFKAGARMMGNAFRGRKFGSVAKGAAGGFGGGVGKFAKGAASAGFSAASITVQAAIEVGKVLYDLARTGFAAVGQIRNFAETTLTANHRFSAFNTQLAYGFQKFSIDQFKRDVEIGNAVEKTALNLVAATGAMRESFKGWDAFAQNTQNRLGAFAAGAGIEIGRMLSPLGINLDKRLNAMDPNGTLFPELGARLVATLTAGFTELLDPLKAAMDPAGAAKRIQDASDLAARNAANAVNAQRQQATDAGQQMLNWVAQGPIRGPKLMPR